MAGRRKTKGANKSDNKVTRQGGGMKTRRPVGVTKRVPKSKTKRTRLIKGLKEKEVQSQKKQQRDHASKNITSAKINSTNKTGNPGPAVPLITPGLRQTLHLLDEGEEEFCVHDMAFVKPDIMVVISVSGVVKVINFKEEMKVLSKLSLSRLTDVSKLDDNRVMFFCPGREVAFAAVIPKLKITEKMALKTDYRLLRVFDTNTLIGITPKTLNNSSVDMLDLKGTKLKTIRPKLLSGLSLQRPEYLYISSQKRIIIVDGLVHIVLCFPSSGTGGFAYSGAGDFMMRPCMTEMEGEEFQKKEYYLFPWRVAADSKGNVFVVDKYREPTVKIDPDGEFVQNILPLKFSDKVEYYHQIYIDEKDRLYALMRNDKRGTVRVFDI